MASARGAAPARVAGRMHHVVIQEEEEEEEHELGGSGESQARCRRRPAHRAAGVGAVRAARGGRGGARRDRFGCADVDAPRDGGGASGGPNILSIAHWDRLLGGALYAPLSRVDWATLLRRTFDVDVKRCTGCAGRMTVRAVVTDPASIARVLGALRRSRDPPVAA